MVVSAVDKKKDTKVAVKKVVSAFDDMLVAKRMIREIRLLRQFDHDNIIRIVDMLPPPSVEKFKDVYMVLDRMDTVSFCSLPFLVGQHAGYTVAQSLRDPEW